MPSQPHQLIAGTLRFSPGISPCLTADEPGVRVIPGWAPTLPRHWPYAHARASRAGSNGPTSTQHQPYAQMDAQPTTVSSATWPRDTASRRSAGH
eukprot:scaffold123105_cov30-Tisochrysis_lutea.AAC.6